MARGAALPQDGGLPDRDGQGPVRVAAGTRGHRQPLARPGLSTARARWVGEDASFITEVMAMHTARVRGPREQVRRCPGRRPRRTCPS